MPFIYKITSPTGKVYIGSTINSVKERWNHYKTLNCKQQRKIYSSLKKHGVNNHIFVVVCETSFENMLSTEYVIGMQYEVLGKNGLNLALPNLFGTSNIISDESRKKMSEAQKGEKSHMFGKTKSYETRLKLSMAHKGKKPSKETRIKQSNAKKGRKLSEEHKLKIKQSNKGKIFTDEHRINLSKANSGSKSYLAKKVKDTKTGKLWLCAKDAATELNINYSTLKGWLGNRNKNKTSLIYC